MVEDEQMGDSTHPQLASQRKPSRPTVACCRPALSGLDRSIGDGRRKKRAKEKTAVGDEAGGQAWQGRQGARRYFHSSSIIPS